MKILTNNIVNQQVKSYTNPNFKGIKVSPKVNREIAKSATNVLTIASTIAVSTIAGIALTKKQKEEEEKQLIQQLKNPNEFIVVLGEELGRHEGIRKNDVYTLAQHFEYAPGFISDLILSKDDNGNQRNIKKSEIEYIMQAYKENPEAVEALVAEKDKKGNFRFSGEEIAILTEVQKSFPTLYETAKKAPIKVYKLSQKRDYNGKFLYTKKDIQTILDIEKNGTEYGKELLAMTLLDPKDPRFKPAQVKTLMEHHKKFPDFVETLVNEKFNTKTYMYTPEEIIECTSLLNDENIEVAKKLYSYERNYYFRSTPVKEFYLCDISNILKAHSISLYNLYFEIANGSFRNSNAKRILEAFNIKTIPQKMLERIEQEVDTKHYTNGLYTLKKLSQT